MKKFVAICAVMLTVWAVSSPALATTVTLVPSALNVTPGSTVDVSVYMTVNNPGITMMAISTNIEYDKNVFTYDDASSVVKGALLTHNWELYGNEYAEGKSRVGGIDWDFGENLAAGSGMLFTFTLQVKADAPTGLSAITWGVYDGFDNATAGFDYGDENGYDIILLDSEMSGASINVIPEPATMCLLGFGVLGLLRKKQ
ncbi:MAG: cohesin domain-containing protein [Phycisphaerae bacterium]